MEIIPDSQPPKNPRRVAAGQRNGLLARGRKSADGRARSALNAARHGLASHQFQVLPMEDPQAFLEFSQALEATLAPQDAYEQTLVTQIITSRWKLQRIDDLERIARTLEHERLLANPSLLPQSKQLFPSEILYWMAFERANENKHVQALHRYRLQYERLVARAHKQLLEYRKSPKPPIADFTDIDPTPSPRPQPPARPTPTTSNSDKTNVSPTPEEAGKVPRNNV